MRDCTQATECPQGAADGGKFVFPAGTVMVKSFSFDGKLVETRLFAHYDADNWVGYTYQWNEAQTEATLVPDDHVLVAFNTGVRTVTWHYPSRLDCMKCHAAEAGSTLGPETAQLNRVVGGTNQMDRFATLGLFDKAQTKPYKAALVTPYPSQAGSPPASATLDQRARSYLHANCAICHRPQGAFSKFDFRNDVSLKLTGVCGVAPDKGDVGVPGSVVLSPTKPMNSVMWLRMNSREDGVAMPQIASAVVDTAGVKLIGDWITQITACP